MRCEIIQTIEPGETSPFHSYFLYPRQLVYPRSIIPDLSGSGSGYMPPSDRPTASQTSMDQLEDTTAMPTGQFGKLNVTSVYQVRPAYI